MATEREVESEGPEPSSKKRRHLQISQGDGQEVEEMLEIDSSSARVVDLELLRSGVGLLTVKTYLERALESPNDSPWILLSEAREVLLEGPQCCYLVPRPLTCDRHEDGTVNTVIAPFGTTMSGPKYRWFQQLARKGKGTVIRLTTGEEVCLPAGWTHGEFLMHIDSQTPGHLLSDTQVDALRLLRPRIMEAGIICNPSMIVDLARAVVGVLYACKREAMDPGDISALSAELTPQPRGSSQVKAILVLCYASRVKSWSEQELIRNITIAATADDAAQILAVSGCYAPFVTSKKSAFRMDDKGTAIRAEPLMEIPDEGRVLCTPTLLPRASIMGTPWESVVPVPFERGALFTETKQGKRTTLVQTVNAFPTMPAAVLKAFYAKRYPARSARPSAQIPAEAARIGSEEYE